MSDDDFMFYLAVTLAVVFSFLLSLLYAMST